MGAVGLTEKAEGDMNQGKHPASSTPWFAEQAFKQLMPEMAALKGNKLLPVNVDIESVTALVLSSLPAIRNLREELLATFRKFDIERFDRLELYPWCLQHAQTAYLSASRKVECSEEVIDAGTKLRRRLSNEARVLAERGLIDRTRIQHLSRTKGYHNLSTDLAILATVLQDAWPKIEGKCAVPTQDLATAAELSGVFVRAASRLEKPPEDVVVANDWRKRAFTNLHRVYNRVRLAVLYTRDEDGDGDKIAPSLFTTRGRRSRANPSNSGESPTDAASAKMVSAPGVPNELESPFITNVNSQKD